MLRTALLSLVAIALATYADAGACLRTYSRADVVQQRVYTPQVQYQVAPQTMMQGADTYDFRRSPEREEMERELLQLRGYVEGVRDASGRAWSPGTPQEEPVEQASAQVEEMPPAAPQESTGVRYPILMTHCARCHNKVEPPADFLIDADIQLDGDDNAWKVVKILKKTYNGKMPIDAAGNPHPLDDKLYGQLEHELLYESVE